MDHPVFSGGSGKRSRTYVFYLAAVVVFVAAIAAYGILSGVGAQADLTKSGLYTLCPASEQVLEALDTNVEIYTLYSPGNDDRAFGALLKEYASESERIHIINIDPESLNSSGRATEFGMQYGSTVVYAPETGYMRTLLYSDIYCTENGREYFDAENKLTDAIRYAESGVRYRVCLFYEHREKDTEEISGFINGLKKRNIEVVPCDLLLGEELDPERDVLISVAPKQDLSEKETALLSDFVSSGGTFILLRDAAEYDEASGSYVPAAPKMPNMDKMFSREGLKPSDSLIYELDDAASGIRRTAIEAEGAVGSRFEGMKAALCECTPVIVYHDAEWLLSTYQTAACEDEPAYRRCVAAWSKKGEGRLVLITSSSLLQDDEALDNTEIIYDILDSAGIRLSQNIPEKLLKAEPMAVEHGLEKILITVLLMLVMPCGVLIWGVKVIKKRRAGGR